MLQTSIINTLVSSMQYNSLSSLRVQYRNWKTAVQRNHRGTTVL